MLTEPEQMIAIQRILDGDIEAFTPMVRSFQEGALRMAHAITDDRAAAEDITQEAFVSAFQNLGKYDASRASFSAWLHAIVRNGARNFLRQRKSRTSKLDRIGEADPVCPRKGPDETLGLQEQMGTLDHALGSLPEDWRRAFTLTEIEGIPYAEAAVMEGIPIGTIRSRVHRSRKFLQDALNQHSNPAPSR